MATQILTIPAPTRYALSEKDRALVASKTVGKIAPESMEFIEEQRRKFICRNGWDGLTGSEPDLADKEL